MNIVITWAEGFEQDPSLDRPAAVWHADGRVRVEQDGRFGWAQLECVTWDGSEEPSLILDGYEPGEQCEACGMPLWQDDDGHWNHVLLDTHGDPIGLALGCEADDTRDIERLINRAVDHLRGNDRPAGWQYGIEAHMKIVRAADTTTNPRIRLVLWHLLRRLAVEVFDLSADAFDETKP